MLQNWRTLCLSLSCQVAQGETEDWVGYVAEELAQIDRSEARAVTKCELTACCERVGKQAVELLRPSGSDLGGKGGAVTIQLSLLFAGSCRAGDPVSVGGSTCGSEVVSG